MPRCPPRSTLFPYTTLFRSESRASVRAAARTSAGALRRENRADWFQQNCASRLRNQTHAYVRLSQPRSEEHTSNSSHQIISYAVFCLKKKKKKKKNKKQIKS